MSIIELTSMHKACQSRSLLPLTDTKLLVSVRNLISADVRSHVKTEFSSAYSSIDDPASSEFVTLESSSSFSTGGLVSGVNENSSP